MDLGGFCDKLDACRARVPLDELTGWLGALEVTLADVADVACFDERRYRRNLLRAGAGYHALVLCWRPGQRSPIHDHRGSSCGVRVLQGTLTETIFERTAAGHLLPRTTHTLRCGEICGSQDADIHQISNLSADEPLVTLHVYTPPLITMGMYSLTDPRVEQFVDPVVGLCDGAGI